MGRIGGIVLANKRMFSVDVTETDAFLEMPLTAQALYFHLGMVICLNCTAGWAKR